MIVVGFITREQIPYQYLLGDGSMVFLPTEGDPVNATYNFLEESFLTRLFSEIFKLPICIGECNE